MPCGRSIPTGRMIACVVNWPGSICVEAPDLLDLFVRPLDRAGVRYMVAAPPGRPSRGDGSVFRAAGVCHSVEAGVLSRTRWREASARHPGDVACERRND